MQDIEQAVSNSLDRDGKGGMRADLPMGGNKITNLADGVADSDAATVGQLSGSGSIPVGTIFDYAGTTPPSGYLLCYGQAVSRATYADLFALLGTAFGTGDGSTTFNLPDLRGRVSAGKDDMGGSAASRLTNAVSGVTGTTLGASGGAQSVTLTTAQLASHTHAGTTNTTGAHTHTAASTGGPANVSGGLVHALDIGNTGSSGNHSHTFTTDAAGSGQAHSNVQPTLILSKIIKATS
jgi:microcystin-dependent protein